MSSERSTSPIYDAFGRATPEVSESGGDPGSRFGYTGQERDFDTGLMDYGARWYDPMLGRFLSADPISEGTNDFAYVFNNPVNLIDPTGMKAVFGSFTAPTSNFNYGSYSGNIVDANLMAGLNGGSRNDAAALLMATPTHLLSNDWIKTVLSTMPRHDASSALAGILSTPHFSSPSTSSSEPRLTMQAYEPTFAQSIRNWGYGLFRDVKNFFTVDSRDVGWGADQSTPIGGQTVELARATFHRIVKPVAQGVGDFVGGVWNLVTHPKSTIDAGLTGVTRFVEAAWRNPSGTAAATWQGIQDWSSNSDHVLRGLTTLGLDAFTGGAFYRWMQRTPCLVSPALARRIPQKATDMLAHVRKTGQAPQGHTGGRVFQNREGKLPQGGKYREYDVDPTPPKGQSRNAERMVFDETSGRAWYTDDHYSTFQEIQ